MSRGSLAFTHLSKHIMIRNPLTLFTLALCWLATQITAEEEKTILEVPVEIKSILSASGDACPGPAKQSVKASARVEDSVSELKVEFAEPGPFAILTQRAVAWQSCEVELELEIPTTETFELRISPKRLGATWYSTRDSGATFDLSAEMTRW